MNSPPDTLPAVILHAVVNDQPCPVHVPDGMLRDAADVFARMDADMDRGWQMSRVWVDRPDRIQRCQIVADRLLTALETENRELAALMAAYILHRVPDIRALDIDAGGDMTRTRIDAGGAPRDETRGSRPQP